ncbi:dihydrofolate reductase [Prescottella agglutinans]|uniref:Dihydrofolate reductase n=1 Tax=Prescottella agglutinans TaxID=1644129 RepID=A0A438B9Y3_9NOCA|nr:DUF732 domain-containing protein [Prescottella agglutinans]RVW07770.1 dihydrofolate reductase [Prescottella agglutinans]
MTSTRAVTAVVAVAGALLLTACGSQDPDPAVAAHETAVSSTRPSATTASAVPIDRSTPAPVPPSDTSTPDPQPTTTVAPPPVTSETSVASAPPPPPPRPPASPSGALDARSPEQVVADSGERGRHYLAALRAGGIPPTGMDAAEVLYAQGTCEALARGDSRASVLAEFDSVGQAYARFVPMSADRIAEIYVSTAERTYC